MNTEQTAQAAEHTGRLVAAGMFGFWLVNADEVDPRKLANMEPGRIIAVHDTSAVRFVPTDTQGIEGCVAGWISEDES